MPTETDKKLKTRQPIVAVLGHVDHGKTTLLDFIRKARVAEREAGGITQAVGAYEAEFNGKKITFIDTPGHEAFSKMRARGAHAADLAILVVAGDESVKPQTVEAIKTLRETETPFVVAITKIDKPGANIEKVKADLAANEVLLEGYGGNISYHGISGKTGEGVNDLLELITLATEVEHLEYDPEANPRGYILETKMNKQRGIEATVILKEGILKRGEDIATPTTKGKARILENFAGKAVNEIEAGAPALILGFEVMPQIGEEFGARDISAITVKKIANAGPDTGENSETTLRLVLKASDQGSLEALRDIITYLDPSKPLKIIAAAVGEIGENDVKLAISSEAVIIGFKTKVDKAARQLAEAHRIHIIVSEIIYDLVKTVQESFAELGRKKSVGELEVLAIFNQEKLHKQVVGGKVIHGNFKNRMQFNLKRGEAIVGTGRITSLQTQKKDANSVPEGSEAGLMASSEVPIAVGDHLIIEEQ